MTTSKKYEPGLGCVDLLGEIKSSSSELRSGRVVLEGVFNGVVEWDRPFGRAGVVGRELSSEERGC